MNNVLRIIGLSVLIANSAATAAAQGTAFTYQGRLNAGGGLASGSYDLTFSVFDATTGLTQVGTTLTNLTTGVSNGLFTVTLDFGGGVFTGAPRWLEIGVRTNGVGAFTILAPRQPLTASPYAVYAGGISPAGISGAYGNAVTFGNSANIFAGNGAGLSSLDASQLTSGTVPVAALSNAWKTTGNSGTTPGAQFIGTTDSQPLEVKVNATRALRLEPGGLQGSPNLSGGWLNNTVNAGVSGAFIGGGGQTAATNRITDDFGFVGGGSGNQAGDGAGTVGDHPYATVAGGQRNFAGGANSAIGGGYGNSNSASATYGTIAGGSGNSVRITAGAIGGGENNLVYANGQDGFIGAGSGNQVSGSGAGILAGTGNWTDGSSTAIGGGGYNAALAYRSFIGAGEYNTNNGMKAVIGGGQQNNAGSSAINGFLGSGLFNFLDGNTSFLGAGQSNTNTAPNSFLGGGFNNWLSGRYSVLAGGLNNYLPMYESVIAGGNGNSVLAYDSAVGGGQSNSVSGGYSVISGGFANANSGYYSSIAGGSYNTVQGYYAFALGYSNTVVGNYGFAGGRSASAGHDGTFVWGGSGGPSLFASTAPDQFLIRAPGGVGIGTNSPQAPLDIAAANPANRPLLRLTQMATNDSARLRFQFAAQPAWDIAVGGASNGMSWTPAGLASAMMLQSNGVLTVNSLIGNGALLTSLSPSNFASGDSGAIFNFTNPANYFAGSFRGTFIGYGFSISNLNPANLTSGTINSPLNVTNWANLFNGTFAGDGGGMSNVNAALLGGLSSSNYWQLGGNNVGQSQFLGSTNNQALELHAMGSRALRLEPNTNGAPNLIGGAPVNFATPGVVAATIGGGGASAYSGSHYTNSVGADFDVVAGGAQNGIGPASAAATISGGFYNQIGSNAVTSVISGGYFNYILDNSQASWIGGGESNFISTNSPVCAIGGGFEGFIGTNSVAAFIGGGYINAISSDCNFSAIGAGYRNDIFDSSPSSVIAGGSLNTIATNAGYSVIGGGSGNTANGTTAVISGGLNNTAAGPNSGISSGEANKTHATADHAFVGGGQKNEIFSAPHAVIAGGSNNLAQATGAAVLGGFNNQAGSIISGIAAVVAGGSANRASGDNSFAAGHRAKALDTGSFVWADSQEADFASSDANQFLVRAQSGMGINTTQPEAALHIFNPGFTTNVYPFTLSNPALMLDGYQSFNNVLAFAENGSVDAFIEAWQSGPDHILNLAPVDGGGIYISHHLLAASGDITAGGSISSTCDRNAKTNFADVNAHTILEKTLALPIQNWNYKKDANSIRHLGPMAQDFKAAFDLGEDDKHISVVDEGGVALAAIQGLNQKLEEKLQQKETEITELKQRLQQIESLLERELNHSVK
jgi:hypothetical protein